MARRIISIYPNIQFPKSSFDKLGIVALFQGRCHRDQETFRVVLSASWPQQRDHGYKYIGWYLQHLSLSQGFQSSLHCLYLKDYCSQKNGTNFLFRHTCATMCLILEEGIFLWWFSELYNLFEFCLAFQYFLSYFQRMRSNWMYLHQNFIYNVSIKSLISELFWAERL